jgi:hypothetical protein
METSRIVAMCLVLLAPVIAFADQPLRYVDEHGVAHWVMSKEQIPAKYRDKVQTPDLPPANSSPVPVPTPSPRERSEERQRPGAEQAAEPQSDKQAPPPVPWAR